MEFVFTQSKKELSGTHVESHILTKPQLIQCEMTCPTHTFKIKTLLIILLQTLKQSVRTHHIILYSIYFLYKSNR